jgi:hypothetical protein
MRVLRGLLVRIWRMTDNMLRRVSPALEPFLFNRESIELSRETIAQAGSWQAFLKFFMQTPTRQTITALSTEYGTPTNDTTTQPFDNFAKSAIFQCHAYTLAETFSSKAHRYIMTIPPASHSMDRLYYFHVDNVITPVSNPSLVPLTMQYVRNLVVRG